MLDRKLLESLGGWASYRLERVTWPEGQSRTLSLHLKPTARAMYCTRAATRARIDAAEEIAGICLAVKRPKMAVDFVKAGLDVEQIRARLFDMIVTESETVVISNLQRPAASEATGEGQLEQVKARVYEGRTMHGARSA